MTEKFSKINDLRILDRELRYTAERWWHVSLGTKLFIFLVGLSPIFFVYLSEIVAVFQLILASFAEYCSIRYGVIRGTWETLHRELDYRDSLGWPISKLMISDILVHPPRKISGKFLNVISKDTYFASPKPVGPRRAIENIQESAWWSKHICKKAGDFYLILALFPLAISVAGFLLSIQTIVNPEVVSIVATIVTTLIMLILSLGLLRIAPAYYKFSKMASSIVERTERLKEDEVIEEKEAIRLIQEYHLARAESPMAPTFLWKKMRDDLNILWREYINQNNNYSD